MYKLCQCLICSSLDFISGALQICSNDFPDKSKKVKKDHNHAKYIKALGSVMVMLDFIPY